MAYNFTKKKKSDHDIFAYHLLVPRGANSSTQRIQMLSQHTAQMMTLANPEFPKVFTNFENMLGQASITGYKKAEQDFIVRNIIRKDKYNYTMIIQYKYSKVYDIINFKCYDHIGALTESYGTKMLAGEALKNAKVGSEVKAGEYLYYTPMYDEDNSFKYGTNLRAAYMPWEGLTHEDAVVLTESAAEKLTSYQVKETEVKIGGNQVFLDLYNKTKDSNTYHSFPHVGEYTNGQILVALRQKTNNKLLYEFQQEKMRQIETTDRIVHCPENSEVVELDIYTTKTPEELRNTNDMFMCEIADVLEEQNRYWEELKIALEEIIPIATQEQITMFMSESEKKLYYNELETFKTHIDRPVPHELNPNSYTLDLGYYWKLAHEYCNRKIKWRTDGTVLDNIIIKFTLLKTDKVDIGLKLSGRYGNKGVISQIIRDDEAPKDAWGRPAEIILNPYGVNNRMNWSQSFEQLINFISDHVQHEIIALPNEYEKITKFFEYMRLINPKEYFYFKNLFMDMDADDKKDFIKSIEKDGIYIHQYPFYGNAKCSGCEKKIPNFTPYLEAIKKEKKAKNKAERYLEYIRLIDELNPEFDDSENDSEINLNNERWNDIKKSLKRSTGHDANEEEIWFNSFYGEFDDQHKKEFWEDIEEYGPLLQPNFITIALKHPEWLTKYKSTGIELPYVIGEEYFIRLKHQTSNKTSLRSAGRVSQKNLPLKTNNNKSNTSLYADTPNRIGRMELNNLLITKDAEMINKFLRSYSTNKEDRHNLIRDLLTSNNPFELRIFINEQKGIPRVQLDEYLKILDLELKDN